MNSTSVLYNKKELEEKSGLKRSTFYYRIEKLGLIPDNSGFYTQEDLELLKRLDQFLKVHPGGGIKLFKQVNGL